MNDQKKMPFADFHSKPRQHILISLENIVQLIIR